MSETARIFHELRRRYPNVTAVQEAYKIRGGKRTPEWSYQVFVSKKLPKHKLGVKGLLPPKIDGLVTDVVEGEFNALSVMAPPMPGIMAVDRTGKHRPAMAGISCGHPQVTAGTLGLWVYFGAYSAILSNNHVIANQGDCSVDDPIYQPGVYDGGGEADTLALLKNWIEINFSGGTNIADAAVAQVINEADVDRSVLDLATLVQYKTASQVGMQVKKSGRTTRVTEGGIGSITWSGLIGYGGGRTAFYADQVYVPDFYFISGGDSGSALLVKKEGAEPDTVTALLFAGSMLGQGISCPILPIFEQLYISLVPPATLQGVVRLGGSPVVGANVMAYSLTRSTWVGADITNSEGEYSMVDSVAPGEQVVACAQYEYGGKTYSQGVHKMIYTDPETLDFDVVEYSPVADGQTVDFKFKGGIGWHELDLILQSYPAVDDGQTVNFNFYPKVTISADILLQAEQEKPFMADVIIAPAFDIKTFTADLLLMEEKEKELPADLLLLAELEKTFTADVVLHKPYSPDDELVAEQKKSRYRAYVELEEP